MKDRIKQVMESQHMSQQVFARFLNLSPASLSSIFNDRTKPTLAIVEAIKNKIPGISTDWLLFGSGSMFLSSESQAIENAADSALGIGDGPVEQMLNFENTSEADESEHRLSSSSFSPSSGSLLSGVSHDAVIRPKEIIKHEVKYIDKPQRKITEIRVYFDDLTYETFVPDKK